MDVANSQAELLSALQNLGWDLQSNKFKGGEFEATAKSEQTGLSISRTGRTPELALAAVYQYARQATDLRARISSWQSDWYDELHPIAQAYRDLPPYESKAVENWQALAHENAQHATLIREQVSIEYSHDPQPYADPKEMVEDVHHKKKLLVSTVELDHPLWAQDDVVNLRICHDVLGICQTGGGWSWPGTNRAVANHMPLLSPEAQEALFVEILARTAYETVYRGLGTPKVALLSEYIAPVRDTEGQHLHMSPAIPLSVK